MNVCSITNPEGEVLLSRIAESDVKALESLFDQYYRPLCRFAFFLTKRHDLAEEIVADVFVSLWNKREHIKITQNVRSYLFSATRNTAINYLKRETRDNSQLPEDLFEAHDNPSELLLFQELESQLFRIINLLPNKRKEIFQLSRFEGLSYHEIATTLCISVKTVENQIGKALKQLKSCKELQQASA